jgi:type I restriction enzyme S subunit
MVNDTQQIPAGYKQTDVGVIPEDWELGHLGAESDLVTKGTTPTSMGKNFTSSGINFVKVESLDENGCFDKSLFAHIDQSTHTLLRRSQLKENDLLISIAGALGRAGIVKSDILPANTNQALSLVRLSKDSSITLSFLYYFVKTPVIKKYIDDVSVQGAQPNLSLKNISDLPIYYPSDIHEQEKIVEILLDIDSLISKLDQLIQKKKNIKQGAMQELLTGKRRLPGFSGEWKVTTLKEITEMSSGGTPSTRINSYYDGNIMWASIADMTNSMKYISSTEKKLTQLGISNSSAKLFPKGTVLYAMYASIGECCIAAAPMASSQAILGIKCLSTIMNEYLYYYLTSMKDYIKTLGQQGTQSNLNKGMVQKFELKLPSIEEQKAIVSILSNVDDEIEILKKKKHKYQDLKQGMMQQLLTGKIRLI